MVNAYVLVFASLILPLGSAGDRWGRKRLLVAGLLVFAAASAAASFATSGGAVIAARAVMGVGAAATLPLTLAALTALYPDAAQRSKAVSVVVAATGLGVPLGPIMGGYLLDRYWWGSIFLVNVPVALLAAAAILVVVPESRDPAPPGTDFVGALLAVAGLASFTYGVIEAPTRGWGSAPVLGTVMGGLLLLSTFAWWERHTASPMVDSLLLHDRRFVGGSVAAAVAGLTLFGLLFVVPLYLQFLGSHDALGTGLRLLPVIGGLVIGAALGDAVARARGHRTPVVAGLALIGLGLAVGATTGVSSEYGFVAAWLCGAGIGIGMCLAPATDAVLESLPPDRVGIGTAMAMTIRYVGGSVGVAVLGAQLSAGYVRQLDLTGVPSRAQDTATESVAGALSVAEQLGNPSLAASASSAFLHGMALVLVTCAAVAVVGALVAATLMPAGRPGAGPRRQTQDAEQV